MNLPFESTKNHRDDLLNLIAFNCYKHGDFTLSSGKKSNHYVNCKLASLSGSGLVLLGNTMLEHVEPTSSSVAGITLGGDPLVSCVSMAAAMSGRALDALIVRKEAKGYGTDAWLEGPLPPKGSLITVLEDVVTTGGSALKAANQLMNVGYEVKRIISIVDRQEGGADAIKQSGLDLISLFSIDEVSERFNKTLK